MCRTRETAWLLAGQVTPTDALIGPADWMRLAELARKQVVETAAVAGKRADRPLPVCVAPVLSQSADLHDGEYQYGECDSVYQDRADHRK